jgi:hypothetical protein
MISISITTPMSYTCMVVYNSVNVPVDQCQQQSLHVFALSSLPIYILLHGTHRHIINQSIIPFTSHDLM